MSVYVSVFSIFIFVFGEVRSTLLAKTNSFSAINSGIVLLIRFLDFDIATSIFYFYCIYTYTRQHLQLPQYN